MNRTVSVAQSGPIAVCTIDNPPLNVLSQRVRRDLLEALHSMAADPRAQAIVLCCAGRTFASGADLAELAGEIAAPGYAEVLGTIESFDRPIIAALHGTTLGAGVELALACHYRIAAANAQLGMPEITLGIVPGAGGTQRLPRLIGAKNALDMLLSGRPVGGNSAKELGLVDEVASGDLHVAATAFAMQLIGSRTPPRRTCDSVVPDLNEDTLTEARTYAAKTLRGRTTPELVIQAVRESSLPMNAGLQRETELSAQSLRSTESKALRHLFFAERQTAKVPGMKSDVAARTIASVGVIGSGTMGRGIAMCFADAGVPVKILDSSTAALANGLARIEDNYRTSVQRGRLREEDLRRRMDLICGIASYLDLREVDLIIEAVPEDMALKRQIFGTLDRVARPGAILATNTSTLDVNEIAATTGRPEDVIGLHFFSPANVMRLLEIVRADRTHSDVVATAFGLARRLGKIGVLSGVCYGFIGNRMMEPYAREAERAVLEGATPAEVDGALESFGMAMGILAVFDLAGVDVGVLTRKDRVLQMAQDPTYYRCSALLYEHGWLGQKSGRGFYTYEGRERKPNPQAEALFREEARRLGVTQAAPPAQEIQQRCLYALVNEGARILAEGIAQRAADIDVVYTSGYGFPRHLGGPMFWADSMGLAQVVQGIEALAQRYGRAQWEPAPLLVELARTGGRLSDWTLSAATTNGVRRGE